MKKIVVSGALSAMLMLPAMGLEIINNDDAKLDVYGSVRGYVGGGADMNDTLKSGYGTYMVGIQSNSRFGFKATMGKFTSNIEFGAAEENGIKPNAAKGTEAGLRQFWGAYDMGFGSILFGKTDTPSLAGMFNSDWLNTDAGAVGFGGLPGGNRRVQIQYNIAGLSIALVEDTRAIGTTNYNDQAPRLSMAYTHKSDGLFLKVGGSYKYYNYASSFAGAPIPTGTNAYHIFVGVKPSFGKAFVSFLTHYGKNANLYGEQKSMESHGGYAHTEINVAGLNAQRAGAHLEAGYNITSDLSFIAGVGYQATFGGDSQGKNGLGLISGYKFFAQLPIKLSKNFQFVPHVAYYTTMYDIQANGEKIGDYKQEAIVAATRLKFDF